MKKLHSLLALTAIAMVYLGFTTMPVFALMAPPENLPPSIIYDASFLGILNIGIGDKYSDPKFITAAGSTTRTAINDLQVRLNTCWLGPKWHGSGNDPRSLVADGKFGPKTRQLVMEFQAEKELKADGVVGKQTKHALFETCHYQDPSRYQYMSTEVGQNL